MASVSPLPPRTRDARIRRALDLDEVRCCCCRCRCPCCCCCKLSVDMDMVDAGWVAGAGCRCRGAVCGRRDARTCLRTAPADCGGLCAPSFAESTSTMPPWRTVVPSLPRTAPADCGGPCALTSAVVVAPPSWEGRSPAASGRTVVQCGRARSKARHTGGKSCVLSPFCSAVTNHLPPCSFRSSSVPPPSALCCCPSA